MLSPRPLADLNFVRCLMDLSEVQVNDLLEEGLVWPAWNISRLAKGKRREVRILHAGLVYFAATQRPLPADQDTICEDLLPPDAPLTTSTLQKTLNCGHELIMDLVRSGCLRLAPGSKPRRGRGGEAKLDRQSTLAWLKQRIII